MTYSPEKQTLYKRRMWMEWHATMVTIIRALPAIGVAVACWWVLGGRGW
jgi:hypothetical protein